MKILYLVRHAKAVKQTDIPDIDRPLDDKGKKDAAAIASRLKDTSRIDALISSPALRALQTAEILAGILGYPADKIMKRKALYDQADTSFRTVVRELEDRFEAIMIFGHNPSITDFARRLDPDFPDELPPSGLVCIQMDASTWKEAVEAGGKSVRTENPEKAPKNESSTRLKKELAGEIAESIYRTFSSRNKVAADTLIEVIRFTAKTLADKFVKRMRKIKKRSNERN